MCGRLYGSYVLFCIHIVWRWRMVRRVWRVPRRRRPGHPRWSAVRISARAAAPARLGSGCPRHSPRSRAESRHSHRRRGRARGRYRYRHRGGGAGIDFKLLLTIYIYLHLHRTAQPLYCTAYGTLHGRTSARRAGVHTSDRAWRIGPAYGTGATDCKQLTSPLAFD